jgi:hypothetical protein
MRHKSRTILVALGAMLALGAVGATSAFASGKPFVETKPATSIGETQAQLNGVVNPNGATTKYWFEYGTTISYGKKTAEVSIGSGTSNLEEFKTVTGLTANTTYHFRVVASNVNGTSDGSDAAFTTAAKPGPPEFVPAQGQVWPIALEGKLNDEEGRPIRFQTASLNVIECRRATLEGEITAAKRIALANDLENCKEVNGSCTSKGAAKGVIVLSGNASLVYISKASKLAGILLPVGEISVECPAVTWKIKGSLLSPISPLNTETTKFELAWHASPEEPGRERYMTYEGEKGELLETKFTVNDGVGQVETALEIPGPPPTDGFGFTTSKTMKVSA